jgi:superfamily II DNA helicase RecQ
MKARSEQHVLADLGIARFKPAQGAAHRMLTDAIAYHRSTARSVDDNCSCLVTLPTSSGKDLLACSIARAFSGTVIVFHPYKALTAAAESYASQFHCSAAVFSTNFGNDCCVDVVVAAYEQAHAMLIAFCASLHRRGRLVAIIYNEAHVALPHVDGNFRDFLSRDHLSINELAPVLRHACQFPHVFVCCTATLQTRHLKLLPETLCMPSFSSVCRASPMRSNLAFSLRVVQNWDQLLLALVAAVVAAPLRVIVFVSAVRHCSVLTGTLSDIGRPVFSYHAGLADDVKAQTLRNFSSLPSVLVTTTALSCGMNVADVSDVIVFGECFSTEALLQCGGRAARHGENGRVVFLTSPHFIHKMSQSDSYGSQQVLSLIRAPSFTDALEQLYK